MAVNLKIRKLTIQDSHERCLNQANNGSILILKLKMQNLCGNVLRDAHVWRYNSNNIVY